MNDISNQLKVSQQISDKRRIVEICGIFATAIGKFVFMDILEWRLYFIATAILGWTVYIVYRKTEVNDILKYWGLTSENFRKTTLKVVPFGVISLMTFFCIGYFQSTINITWHIIPILILYPIWGTIQQLLIIALIAGNLKDFKGNRFSNPFIILMTAALFAIVHFPYYWLMLGTFLLAIFYGYIYLKVRNLYVLGIFHGWLGAFFFYTVVDRDPFMEVFGAFL